jgi:hypothetical protein
MNVFLYSGKNKLYYNPIVVSLQNPSKCKIVSNLDLKRTVLINGA